MRENNLKWQYCDQRQKIKNLFCFIIKTKIVVDFSLEIFHFIKTSWDHIFCKRNKINRFDKYIQNIRTDKSKQRILINQKTHLNLHKQFQLFNSFLCKLLPGHISSIAYISLCCKLIYSISPCWYVYDYMSWR